MIPSAEVDPQGVSVSTWCRTRMYILLAAADGACTVDIFRTLFGSNAMPSKNRGRESWLDYLSIVQNDPARNVETRVGPNGIRHASRRSRRASQGRHSARSSSPLPRRPSTRNSTQSPMAPVIANVRERSPLPVRRAPSNPGTSLHPTPLSISRLLDSPPPPAGPFPPSASSAARPAPDFEQESPLSEASTPTLLNQVTLQNVLEYAVNTASSVPAALDGIFKYDASFLA